MKTFSGLVDLASERLGARALYCSDDFFAEKENLLKAEEPVFVVDKYTDHGKWMDGWESRSKRFDTVYESLDWCVIGLGAAGVIHGVNIDTSHFLGNHPPYASIEGCYLESKTKLTAKDFERAKWQVLLSQSALVAGSKNVFSVQNAETFTHLRLNIYPDGGVARLRVFGEVTPPALTKKLDLAALVNGARVLACNDMFFGSMHNLIFPDRAPHMGDGWETKRKRNWNTGMNAGPKSSNDWCIVELAGLGILDEIEIDTTHFKGNFPDQFSLFGLNVSASNHSPLSKITDLIRSSHWELVTADQKLKANGVQKFSTLKSRGPFTHIKLCIFPDGGVSRLRLWGKIAK